MTLRKLKKLEKKAGTWPESTKPYFGYAYNKSMRKKAKRK